MPAAEEKGKLLTEDDKREQSGKKRGETAGKGKIIHGISAIYLFMVACMVPLYMYDEAIMDSAQENSYSTGT